MSSFTKLAVIGVGGVGSGIVNGLLKADGSVTILSGDDGQGWSVFGTTLMYRIHNQKSVQAELQPLKERGATLVKVNYEDETSLKEALDGIAVVVCSINSQHLASPFTIVRAAKAASIQLFVPTEFGFREEDGANTTKQEVRDLLKKLELPYALFHSGLWSEYLPFILGYNFDEGTISVAGEGDAKMSIV